MFGVSFLEIAVIGLVALLVVGPHKLPAMMRTAGEWMGKLRRITSDVRAQTGIDDILREEGIDGVGELRTLLRGQGLRSHARAQGSTSWAQPVPQPADLAQEFPVEGVDCSSALADDLLAEPAPPHPAPGGEASPTGTNAVAPAKEGSEPQP